jgi:hypothetical protein
MFVILEMEITSIGFNGDSDSVLNLLKVPESGSMVKYLLYMKNRK